MKLLYIVRHAKSSWDFPGLPDHERPIIEKGRNRLKKIINYLLSNELRPQLILSSTALRATETAQLIAAGLNVKPESVKTDAGLYHGESEYIFSLIENLSDHFESVMIVGHNPALTAFVNYFLNPHIDWLPTSGVFCLQLNTAQWAHIKMATHEVKFVIFPKLLSE